MITETGPVPWPTMIPPDEIVATPRPPYETATGAALYDPAVMIPLLSIKSPPRLAEPTTVKACPGLVVPIPTRPKEPETKRVSRESDPIFSPYSPVFKVKAESADLNCMETEFLYPKYMGAVSVRYIPVSLLAPAEAVFPSLSLAVEG